MDDSIEINIIASQKNATNEDMLNGDIIITRLVGLLSDKETN